MKEWMKKLVGLDKLEKENKELKEEIAKRESIFDTINGANRELAHQVIALEKELDAIKDDNEVYVEERVARIELGLEEKYKGMMEHKWYGIGRQDAYAEMGIRNIEAHEMGGFLAIMPDGEIIPLLSLEDFTDVCEVEIRTHIDLDEEDESIFIDDLAEIGEKDEC